jgi:hypothetical protein
MFLERGEGAEAAENDDLLHFAKVLLKNNIFPTATYFTSHSMVPQPGWCLKNRR